ncbi:MAG: T9SS type A sorting domain-containing protein, partial [Candidatus Marinimicrobia bacterium]|nr:T9SS type A sorting domain-containing protein [Candidatus Neomarinimicrobiota bacterium]
EGQLFGYPECCIDNFLENGYSENGFEGQGQELLFYWACPGCKITPELIPFYREIYESLDKREDENSRNSDLFKKAAVSALIMVALGSGLKAQDAHLLPVKDDMDKNYLNYQEEILSGYFTLSSPEKEYLAYKYFQLIDSLPNDTVQDSCYKIDHKMRGVVECPICGEMVNMGYVEIHNPMRNLKIELDYMALHFMEKGSFSHGDSIDFQRVDLKKLKQIFVHRDDSHDSAQVAFDNDQDGLVDSVESLFGMQPDDKDSDDNQLLDGDQAAEQLVGEISELPLIFDSDSVPDDRVYILFELYYGLEECNICGKSVNMGNAIITNPEKDVSYRMPIIALHYLAHGCFAYAGDLHENEINVASLYNVLNMETSIESSELKARDYEINLKTYPNPFNSELTIEFQLPRNCHAKINIYNLLGQKIATVFDKKISQGAFQSNWYGKNDRGDNVSSGIYFLELIIEHSPEEPQRNKIRRVLLVQ